MNGVGVASLLFFSTSKSNFTRLIIANNDGRFSIVSHNQSALLMRSQLILDNATLKDSGLYQCLAENFVGYAEKVGHPYIGVHGEFLCS